MPPSQGTVQGSIYSPDPPHTIRPCLRRHQTTCLQRLSNLSPAKNAPKAGTDVAREFHTVSPIMVFPLIFLGESYRIVTFQTLVSLVCIEKTIPSVAVVQSKQHCALNPLNSSRCAAYKACSDQPVRYQEVRRADRAFTVWTGLHFSEMVSNVFF